MFEPLNSVSKPTRERIDHRAVLDSGATGHYLTLRDASCIDPDRRQRTICVELPDGRPIWSHSTGSLKLAGLPPSAREAEVFKDLSKWSLLSVGKLCDAGITVIFTSGTVEAFLEGRVVLKGQRSPATNNLYTVNLNPEDEQGYALNVFPTGTIAKLVAFYHGCFCSPSIPTFLLILELGLKCPGISRKDIYKYPPISAATAAGHYDGRRFVSLPNHLRPDPPVDTGSKGEDQSVPEPPPDPSDMEEGDIVIFKMVPIFDDAIHGDLMGKYPHTSLSGNNYLLVLHSHKTDYLRGKTLPNRTGVEITKAYIRAFKFFLDLNVHTKFFRMDNETSDELDAACEDLKVTIQLVTTGQHRANTAERGIRTYRNHFIAGLATCDPSFPKHQWDQIKDQVEMTLAMSRRCPYKPSISVYEALFGPFDFNVTPLAPPGCLVEIIVRPETRRTFAHHGIKGHYV